MRQRELEREAGKFKMEDLRKERSFPEVPGVPNRSELMKPLIFPNHQRGFKIFTFVVTAGEHVLLQEYAYFYRA